MKELKDPTRIPKILGLLGAAWQRQPDQRLGQLLDNARVLSGNKADIFYVDDQAMEDGLKEFIKRLG